MTPRPIFEYDGKQCYVIAELSTCHAKSMDLILSTLNSLSSVPIECRERDMRFSGMSVGQDYYIDIKLAPLASEATASTYVDTRVSEESTTTATTTAGTKRKRKAGGGGGGDDATEVYKNDDTEAATQAPLATATDYYRRYDNQDVTVQVDIDCLLHMVSVAKSADTLSITVFSFSANGEAERLLVKSTDRNTTTMGVITPQNLTCEVWTLPKFNAVSMVIMQAASLSERIKSVTGASQSNFVTIGMTGNQDDTRPGASRQILTLRSNGDIGVVESEIRSDLVANVKFTNGRSVGTHNQIRFSGRYGSKPLIQIGRIAPICKFVRMYLSPQQPLKLHYTLPDLGDLFFFLSPRIEDDDDNPPPAVAPTTQQSCD